jgi:hypothetical protein
LAAKRQPPANAAAEFNRQLVALGSSKTAAIPAESQPRDAGELAAPEAFLTQRSWYSHVEELLYLDLAEAEFRNRDEASRWRRELGVYVAALAQWSEAGAARDEYYLEKAELLERAIGLQDTQFRRDANTAEARGAAKLLVQFLDGEVAEKVYRSRRAVWFVPVMYALGSAVHGSVMDTLLVSAKGRELQLYGLLGRLLAGARQVYY